jgi:hypothetical protein
MPRQGHSTGWPESVRSGSAVGAIGSPFLCSQKLILGLSPKNFYYIIEMSTPTFHILRCGYADYANPCHNPAGAAGGQFCSGSGDGGKSSSQESWAANLTTGERNAINIWEEDIPTVLDIRAIQAGKEPEYFSNSDITTIMKDLDSAMQKSPDYDGTVYRGYKGKVEHFNKGDEITFNSVSSSSKNFDTAKYFATSHLNMEEGFIADWKGPSAVFQINLKTGVDLAKVSVIPEQKEVLIRQGTKFKVERIGRVARSYTGKYNTRLVVLREI